LTLSNDELKRRRPVWIALSDLWLDTELSDSDLTHIASVMDESGYSIEELRSIYMDEVVPVVYRNLLSFAGVWDGFDEKWLVEKITELLRKQNIFIRLKHKIMRKIMLYATEDSWKKLVIKINNKAY
jgi:hypothetical protein